MRDFLSVNFAHALFDLEFTDLSLFGVMGEFLSHFILVNNKPDLLPRNVSFQFVIKP